MRISDWSSDVCSSDLRDVQIHLHDALLAPEVLDKDGEPCLQAFAEEPSILPQKGVLGCLLADRRSAANFPAAHIANEGVFNGVRIEHVMAAKSTVLSSNGGAGHARNDLVNRHPRLGNDEYGRG